MADQSETVSESLGIELDTLTVEDRINLVEEIFDTLTAQQLRKLREVAEKKRLEKLGEAKAQVIAEMREKFVQLDLNFDEVMGLNRRRRKSAVPPKYKSPAGETWSGRGNPPRWIRYLEEEGGNREDYLIKNEE